MLEIIVNNAIYSSFLNLKRLFVYVKTRKSNVRDCSQAMTATFDL